MNKRIPSLDLLRFLAILSVLLLHSLDFSSGLPALVNTVFSFGWIGVDLFFVLSGFLIGGQAFNTDHNESSPILKFFTKRFFRTMPLYYFVLIVYLLKPMIGFPFNDTILKYFFFVQNFFSPRDFVQSWSLCIEEQFYFLFPLIYFNFKFKKIPAYFWLLPGLFSVVVRLVFFKSGVNSHDPTLVSDNYRFLFFTHLDGIAWGLFLARSFEVWSKFQNKKYFLLSGIVCLFVSLNYMGPLNLNSTLVLGYQLLSISFSLILIGLYDLPEYFGGGVIQKIATWSYGIYLWNNLVSKIVLKIFPNQNYFFKVSFFIFGTVLISAVTYYLIEKPTLKMRNKILIRIK